MFTAAYPASLLPEENGQGFHVRFQDLPEALTGGDNLEDTLAQAADCLARSHCRTNRPRRRNSRPFQIKARPISDRRSPLPGAEACPLSGHARERNAKYATGETPWRDRNRGPPDARPKHSTKPEKIQSALAALGKANRYRI